MMETYILYGEIYKGYIFEVDDKYPKSLHSLDSDLPFLGERIKISQCKKLVSTLYDKNSYVVHIRSLKQALYRRLIFKKVQLDHGLILKKVHKVIQFNQEAWLNEYIDINTKPRTEAKKSS